MTVENRPTFNEPESLEAIEELPFRQIVTAYYESEEFKTYAPSTQAQYKTSLNIFSKYLHSEDITDTSTVLDSYDEFAKTTIHNRSITPIAVRSVTKWSVNKGLVDDENLNKLPLYGDNKQKEDGADKRRTKIVQVLSNEQLLGVLSNSSVQDRALYITILITKFSSGVVCQLKTTDFELAEDGSGNFSVGNYKIPVPKAFAVYINEHKSAIPNGFLFPTRSRDKTKPITRQALHQKIDIARKNLDIPGFSYGSLQLTGERYFGKAPYDTRNNSPLKKPFGR